MKRAAGHPVFLELHVVLNDADDVCLSFEIVDESLGVTHWEKLLSQLDYGCTSPALIGRRGQKSFDVRMTVEQTADCASQCAGAVSVHDAHFGQVRERRVVEEFIDGVDGFVGCLADDVQF